MTSQITKAQATAAAREFVASYVNTGMQWSTDCTMVGLSGQFVLIEDAEFADAPTIANVAAFLRGNVVAA